MRLYRIDYTDYADGEYGESIVEIKEPDFESFKEMIIDTIEDKIHTIVELQNEVYKLKRKLGVIK